MTYDFDTPVDRRGTASFKWDKYAGRDVLPMWVADMDLRSPPEVIEALRRRAEHGIFGYTHPPKSLDEAVVRYYAEQYGWEIEPNWIVWLPGLGVALQVMCRAVGKPGYAVLNCTPVYPPFLKAVTRQERRRVDVPLTRDGGRWVMDFAAMDRAAGPETHLMLFCHPHNPTGRLYTPEELAEVADFAERHDLVVCSDEVHCGLVLEEGRRHVPLASLSPEVADRTVTFYSPSKTFNVPGLNCALAIIPNKRLRAAFAGARLDLVPGGNLFGFTAAEAALTEGEPWRRELVGYLRGNRDLVEREVASMPGLEMTHVEATYLAWIDARELMAARADEAGADGFDPVEHFEAAGVGLSDGAAFAGEGFVRLNFGCPRSQLAEALRRIRAAL